MLPADWQRLIQATEGMSRPARASGVIASEDLPVFREFLKEAVASFCRTKDPGVKVFVDRVLDQDYRQKLSSDPPVANETLIEWHRRFFFGHSGGLIMNFLERYSNDLVERVAGIAGGLLATAGLPAAGLSMLFLMGDYGFTPFGVHRGSPGEDGFLFHLGPGPKTFYAWDTEDYLRLSGGAASCHDVEALLPAARSFALEPGDAIFIPDDLYHVAHAPEFSASLVLDFRRPSRRRMLELLIDRLGYAESDETFFIERVSIEDLDRGAPNISTGFLSAKFDEAWQDLSRALRSNGGFFSPARLRPVKPFPDDLHFRLKSPFQLQIARPASGLTIYSRGHAIKTVASPILECIVSELNEGASMDVAGWSRRLAPDLELPEVHALLARLAQTDVFAQVRDRSGQAT